MLTTLAQWRAALPVTKQGIYLQTGSLGPLSRPVLQALVEAEELAAQAGPAAPAGLTPLGQASEAARIALADLLHVPVHELCWSLNTSMAMRTVIHSLRLTSADCLIASDQEHVATRSLYNGLRDELGLRIVVVGTEDGVTGFLEQLEALLQQPCTGRCLLLLSHVSCIDGRILPVREVVALGHRYGAISLIDGAQAVGQFPVDLQQLAADFYIGSGHKWLLGPSGIGYIHIHPNRLAAFNPHWLPLAARQGASAATLGEVGTTNLAQRAALRVALEQFQTIGVATVTAHVRQLAQQLRSGLCQLPGVSLLGPDDPEQQTGLLGFTVTGWSAPACQQLVERLYRHHQILIKYQPEHQGLRVSLAAFNIEAEVSALLGALAQELGSKA